MRRPQRPTERFLWTHLGTGVCQRLQTRSMGGNSFLGPVWHIAVQLSEPCCDHSKKLGLEESHWEWCPRCGAIRFDGHKEWDVIFWSPDKAIEWMEEKQKHWEENVEEDAKKNSIRAQAFSSGCAAGYLCSATHLRHLRDGTECDCNG